MVFYRSLLHAAAPLTAGAAAGATGVRKGDIISPIDHPTRGPTPFLDPFRAARSLAARAFNTTRVFLLVIAFVIHCRTVGGLAPIIRLIQR